MNEKSNVVAGGGSSNADAWDSHKRMGTARRSGSIHKALNLPGTYQVGTSMEGRIGNDHHSLRMMISQTGGTGTVWAHAFNWGKWMEVTPEIFNVVALQILGVQQR